MRKVLIWTARTLAGLFLAAFLSAAAWAGWLYWNVAKSLPDHRLASETSSWSGCLPAGSNRQFVPVDEIPANAVHAFLAAEDPDFFNRPTFSPVAAIAEGRRGTRPQVWLSPLSFRYAQGLLICHSRVPVSFELTLKTALLTYRIERDLPKRNILGTVINTLYFGRGSYGMAAGAEAYFHKPLNQLSLAGTAFLGGILKEPSRYDGSARAEKFFLERRNLVLERMVRMGAISPQQAEAPKLEPLGVQKREPVSKDAP